MEKVLHIHDQSSRLFLQPARSKNPESELSMAGVLKRWGSIYTPGFHPPQPTLGRKVMHTSTKDLSRKIAALIAHKRPRIRPPKQAGCPAVRRRTSPRSEFNVPKG